MEQTTYRVINVRARAFYGRLESIQARVEPDRSVLVWDSVAGHFTRCHGLSESAKRRIRRLARS